MEHGVVARFERKVLFRITCWLALGLSLLLFLALIAGSLMLLGTLSSGVEKPDPAAVVSESGKTVRDDGDDGELSSEPASSLDGVRLPTALQELFVSDKNRGILEAWLDEIEHGERQSFVDALGQAVSAAKAAGQSESDALNSYHSRYQSYVMKRKLAEAKAESARVQIYILIASALALIALFSLVLVLMAIERNTRNAATQEA